jgi:hypothetical protein
MSRGKKIVSGIVGAGLTFGAGVALAAFLLQTNVTGNATVTQGGPGSGTANEVSVSVQSTNGSQLNCDDIGISSDFKTLTFNPKLVVPQNGPNASGQPIPGGDCKVSVTVKNTGSKAIAVSPESGVALPSGWVPTDFSIPNGAIAPGGSQVISAKIVATDKAQSGAITGKLVYTDAS